MPQLRLLQGVKAKREVCVALGCPAGGPDNLEQVLWADSSMSQ